MIKKLIFVLCALMILTCGAYAAEPTDSGDAATVTVTDITPESEAGSQGGVPDILPQSVETRTEGETELLVKTYELPCGDDPAAIAAETTERGGVAYTLRDMTKQDMEPVIVSKSVSQEVTVSADSDQTGDILPLLKESIPYDAEGYTGNLFLDESSISTEVESTTGYNYTVKEVREYTGLTRNDPYLVPKTVEKNGLTYQLADIQWSGGSENDPTASYTATAVFTALASGQKPDGFTATAIYTGEVSKEEPGNVQYTLIYEPVPAPVVAEPEKPVIDWMPIIRISLIIIGIAGFIATAVFVLRKFGPIKRKNVYHPDAPIARPARRKPHALGYMRREGGTDNA
jgi:hypothetical protein